MVDAYFPCHRQANSANEVLYAYRRHYPDTKIVMVNDQGDRDLKILAEKYNCDYTYEDENIGYPGGQKDYKQIIRWLKRFFTHIKKIDADWFMLMEDDVYVMGRVDTTKLNYDICGINYSNILPPPATQLIHRTGNHLSKQQFVYGAMGGSIYRKKFFVDLEWSRVEEASIKFGMMCPEHITPSHQNWYYSDVLLSYICYYFGGTIGPYSEFAELWYSDLSKRMEEKKVSVLNQYKFLYGYKTHKHLYDSVCVKYTVVIPTRGEGDAYDIFTKKLWRNLINRLHDVYEFIIIAPDSNLNTVKRDLNLDLELDSNIRFIPDSDLVDGNITHGWIKQQIIKLKVADVIRTDHYLILDDDMILCKDLHMADMFNEKGEIYYSFEAWPNPSNFKTHYATDQRWWISSMYVSKLRINNIQGSKALMGVTPQLMITRVVSQCVEYLDKNSPNWQTLMQKHNATEYAIYWLYLNHTLRTSYYTPDNRMFAMDNNINVLKKGLTDTQVRQMIKQGLNKKKYYFIVVQSWLRYDKDVILDSLTDL